MVLSGKEVAAYLQDKIIKVNKKLKPKLAIIQLIDEESLQVYLNSRIKLASKLNIEVECFNYVNRSFDALKKLIEQLNNDDSVWGIMLDHPFPSGINEQEIIDFIDPKKDVEGLTSYNLTHIKNNSHYVAPPVASAVILMSKFYNIDLSKKSTAVIGDSIAVGKPIAQLLKKEKAKVKSYNRFTFRPKRSLLDKEIIVSAVGKPEFIKSKNVPENSILFDIGVNINKDGKVCGDFEKECYDKSSSYSPSPGGVGPITTTMLFYNLFVLRGIIHE